MVSTSNKPPNDLQVFLGGSSCSASCWGGVDEQQAAGRSVGFFGGEQLFSILFRKGVVSTSNRPPDDL